MAHLVQEDNPNQIPAGLKIIIDSLLQTQRLLKVLVLERRSEMRTSIRYYCDCYYYILSGSNLRINVISAAV
jgi:hypothetical protein